MRVVATALITAAALAVPATADAARTYVNNSSKHGASAVKYGYTLQRFELYCSGGGFTQTTFSNHFVFTLRDPIGLSRSGRFSYSGIAFRYGNAREPRGKRRVRVSGRVTSRSLHATWRLPGCGRGSVTARRI